MQIVFTVLIFVMQTLMYDNLCTIYCIMTGFARITHSRNSDHSVYTHIVLVFSIEVLLFISFFSPLWSITVKNYMIND